MPSPDLIGGIKEGEHIVFTNRPVTQREWQITVLLGVAALLGLLMVVISQGQGHGRVSDLDHRLDVMEVRLDLAEDRLDRAEAYLYGLDADLDLGGGDPR